MSSHDSTANGNDQFKGFQSLDANFIYCPNQFFDYALRYSKRSTIRLVNHVLHSTLRWLDEDGTPINQAIAVPHRDLRAKVRISKGSYDEARSEALQLRLIEEVVSPQSKAKRQEAVTGCYALKWDDRGEYYTSLGEFAGFFAKEGNRTAVPEEFFTFIIPSENLNVIKVVAAVLRHTIGYENQFGQGRRKVAALSLSWLQEYTGITNRTRLLEAIAQAIKKKYIKRVSAGVSVQDSPHPESATYCINWLEKANAMAIGSERGPDGSKMVPGDWDRNGTSVSVQKGDQDRSRIGTSIGSERGPGDRYRNGTNRKKNSKVVNKQHNVVVQILKKEGLLDKAAKQIADMATQEVVEQQIIWLPYRDPSSNRLGMLRKAILENWSEPSQLIAERQEEEATQAAEKQAKQARDSVSTGAAVLDVKGEQQQYIRQASAAEKKLLRAWYAASLDQKETAYEHAVRNCDDPAILEQIHSSSDLQPHRAVLEALERLTSTPLVTK